jgi:uncharacterized protein
MRLKLSALVGILFLAISCSDYANESVPTQGQSSNGKTKSISRPLPVEYQNPNTGDFSVEKMLVNIGLNVIAKNVEDFYFKSGRFSTSVAEYCDSLQHSNSAAQDISFAENNVKNIWKETMLSFHKVSMSGVGPLTDNNRALFNKIYSWPVVSECGIDQEVIKNQGGVLADDVLANRRSLSALEYLLFESTLTSKCSAFAEPKAKEWSAKSEFEKKQDRCQYAKKVAQDVQKNAELLRNAWAPDKENYTVALIDKSIHSSVNQAVNALTDSLFAFEDFRDNDLAIPLGLHADCKDASGKCLESLEHPWSGIAAEAAIAQMQGFKEAFFGSKFENESAFGFDDYLVSKGHSAVAQSMKDNLASALQGMGQLAVQDPALRNSILNAKKENCNVFDSPKESLDFVCQIYKDIQNVTSTLKIDVMIILALNVPTGHAGDAD